MRRLVTATAALAVVAFPAAAAAKPEVCQKALIAKTLKTNGKPTGAGVSHVECADVTGDGQSDAVFTIAGTGTQGSTHFGVLEGPASSPLLFKRGTHVGIDARSPRRFDVQQPVYEEGDGAPVSYEFTPYRFAGDAFVAGKAHSYPNAKARFSE